MSKKLQGVKGFTLVELLIVIAVIAIIAAVAFVALDPLTRFRDSRDSARWQDVSSIANAIAVDQVDNGGSWVSEIAALTNGEVYMISTAASGCDANNANCDTNVTAGTNCVDLTSLVTEGYLGEVPISPDGAGSWSGTIAGYTIETATSGNVTVRACESENSSEIYITR